MSAMQNAFEHIQSGLLVREPNRGRGTKGAEAPGTSQDAECTCPELCCVDHDN